MNYKLLINKGMTILLTLVVLLSVVAPTMAGEDKATQGGYMPVVPSQGQGLTDPAELEAFLDDLMAEDMEAYHIPGAAVSVVKDGRLFFAKGYGYAELENKIPVNAEQTVFAIGSLGKTFTWTAVMQLVEQGKLDLEADVNTYLDFRIPDTYPQPITLRHLMTHSSGFENRLLGSIVADASELVSARDWLVSNMSTRVRPAGDAPGYANYNAALAGYIVARVSGQPYDQYIQEHIFNPLGMVHSTVQSPPPPDLSDYLSVGYTYVDGVFKAHPDYVAQPAVLPSGSHRASATDMARFMIALLQGGFYGDASTEMRILEETTARHMQSTAYTPDPRLQGTTFGFFDFSDNGQQTLGNTGYSTYMNSMLLLLPEQNLGVFVVYNSMGGENLTPQHLGFQRAFFDHYFPAPAVTPVQPPADFARRAGSFVGSYRNTMRSYTTADKIGALFSEAIISDTGDGALLLNAFGYEWRFVEVEPLYFRQVDGNFALVFREDDKGHIVQMFTNLTPQLAFDKLKWYETLNFNMILLQSSALIFLIMIPITAFVLIRDRRRSGNRKTSPGGSRTALWIILGISILNLVVVVYSFLWLYPVMLFGFSTLTKIVLGLGVLSAVLTVAALVYTVLAWKDRYWGTAFCVYYTLVTVAAVAYVWFLNFWNLLGWRY
jgi:CubicO group peptidase (beta-lactamase class C family)